MKALIHCLSGGEVEAQTSFVEQSDVAGDMALHYDEQLEIDATMYTVRVVRAAVDWCDTHDLPRTANLPALMECAGFLGIASLSEACGKRLTDQIQATDHTPAQVKATLDQLSAAQQLILLDIADPKSFRFLCNFLQPRNRHYRREVVRILHNNHFSRNVEDGRLQETYDMITQVQQNVNAALQEGQTKWRLRISDPRDQYRRSPVRLFYSPNGRYLGYNHVHNGPAKVYDLSRPRFPEVWSSPHTKCVIFATDGSLVAICRQPQDCDYSLCVWDLDRNVATHRFIWETGRYLTALQFHVVIIEGANGTLLWDWRSPNQLVPAPTLNDFVHIYPSPTDDLIVVLEANRWTHLLHTFTDGVLNPAKELLSTGPPAPVGTFGLIAGRSIRSGCFAVAGTPPTIAHIQRDTQGLGEVSLWATQDLDAGPRSLLDLRFKSPVALSPDGTRLVDGGDRTYSSVAGDIEIYSTLQERDLSQEKKIRLRGPWDDPGWNGQEPITESLAWSPDGLFITLLTKDKDLFTIRVA